MCILDCFKKQQCLRRGAVPHKKGTMASGQLETEMEFVPMAETVEETPVGNEFMRFSKMVDVGKGAAVFLGSNNPLKGVKSLQDMAIKVQREAKNIANPKEFSKPADRAELMNRLGSNLNSFKTVYSMCYLTVMLYFVLTSPFLLFEIALITGLWFYFFKFHSADQVVKISSHSFGRKEKMLVLVPLTTFVAFFGGLISTFIYMFLWGSVLVGVHASFRQPLQADPLDELEDSIQESPV